VLAAARATAVPAGAALAVDREAFAGLVTAALDSCPDVSIERREAAEIPDGPVIVAAGPLPGPGLESTLSDVIGASRLHFFDAAAPIIDASTLDPDRCFPASRYGKGEGDDYVNCPLEKDDYERFVDALLSARRVELRDFETSDLFQACQPVEEIARKGRDALRFGPMKPVGLTDPSTGRRPWAVVQLRAENPAKTAFNLVGFQTNLTFGEQAHVFRMVPGLEGAEFLRYGVMHRNTFVDAPRLLAPGLHLREGRSDVFLAGQLMGTEGYLEAATCGLVAALNVWASLRELPAVVLPRTTCLGALLGYATDPDTVDYQPMHVNFGLLPPLQDAPRGKRERHAAFSARGEREMRDWLACREDLRVRETAKALEEVLADGA
jgi:methylenetetrahydrofolate--tRNA-(uracil-5-)-methyltransferase